MAMLTTAFGKIEGEGYANTFSTGNLKKAVIALSEFIINKDKVQLSKSLLYIRIVISFVVGAIISALLQKYMGIYTILIAAFILISVLIFYSFLIYRRERNIQ